MLHKKKTEIHFLPIWLFITSIFWFAGMMIGKLYIASSFFAFISAYIYFWHLFKLYKVKKWEKTEGIILNHKVDKFDVENGSRGTVERYRPYYLYEYTFNGKTYKNDLLGILKKDFSEPKEFVNLVERKIEKNSKKAIVHIYYDPVKPENSILINDLSSGRKLLINIYLFFSITLFVRVMLYKLGII